MTAKEYLKQYREIEVKINAELETIELLKSQAMKVTSIVSDMPKSKNSDNDFTNIVNKIIDVSKKMNNDIDAKNKILDDIRAKIDSIKSITLQNILILRYINGKSFEQIAVETNYCWRHLIRLHGTALQEFEKILKQNKDVIECHI